MERQAYIEVDKITKIFPGTTALNEVSFNVRKGEVHAIVGENGAGKSTLMKILSGVYKKTTGTILVDGIEAIINSTFDSIKLGIIMVYQELENFPKLSIAENILVGRLPKNKLGIVNFKFLFKKTQEIFNSFKIDIDVTLRLSSLTVAEKQFVEIIKAVTVNDASIVIMDEPTSSLTEKDIEKLFSIIKQLKEKNIGIVYISHRMDEVVEIADRLTVLRDGKNCGTLIKGEFNSDKIISMMLGHSINKGLKGKTARRDVIFEVKNLFIAKRVNNFNAKLYEGEVLGIAGLMGSGKDELVNSLFGLWPTVSKEIFYYGKKVTINNPREALKLGIAYLPAERKIQSLFLELNVKMNIITTWLYNQFNNFFINGKLENILSKKFIEKLSIKTLSPLQIILNLSGGNQQKAIIARLLAVNPKIMILNDPTRGIDVGSKEEIYRIIRELTEHGTSIVLVSSELEEIYRLSNRVIVLSKGDICGEFIDEDVTLENILLCAVRMKKIE